MGGPQYLSLQVSRCIPPALLDAPVVRAAALVKWRRASKNCSLFVACEDKAGFPDAHIVLLLTVPFIWGWMLTMDTPQGSCGNLCIDLASWISHCCPLPPLLVLLSPFLPSPLPLGPLETKETGWGEDFLFFQICCLIPPSSPQPRTLGPQIGMDADLLMQDLMS